jgi:superfamily I DNA/RNA helicase
VISNPKDQEALLRIINYPRRGISARTLEVLTEFNRMRGISLWDVLLGLQNEKYELDLSPQAKEGIECFVLLIQEAQRRFESESLKDSYNWLVEEISYKEMIQAEVKSGKAQEFRFENVILVGEMLSTFEEENPGRSLYEFLSETMLDSDQYQRNRVTLETESN